MIWLKFTLCDRDYRVTLDRLSIAEAREVKKFTGVTLTSLMLAASGQVDGDVLAAVVFLAKRRAGEEVDWAEIDGIDVVALIGAMSVVDEPEDAPELPSEAATPNGKRPVKRTAKPRAVKPAPDPEQESAVTT